MATSENSKLWSDPLTLVKATTTKICIAKYRASLILLCGWKGGYIKAMKECHAWSIRLVYYYSLSIDTICTLWGSGMFSS